MWTGVFFVALVSNLPDSLISAPLALLVIVIASEIGAQIRLLRMRARPLTSTQAPELFSMIDREADQLGISKSFTATASIYCVPNGTQASAFILGGFSQKIVVTGRLAVAALELPAPTEIIVRHELAHIANRDSRMWLVYVTSFLSVIPSLLNGAAEEGYFHPLNFAITRIVGLIFGLGLTAILFWRREYLADAVEMNRTKDRELYLKLLAGGSGRDSGWFHPRRADRVAALLTTPRCSELTWLWSSHFYLFWCRASPME
jgi:Zn-dependent protease with chaperone function